jgi:hypothetical protein
MLFINPMWDNEAERIGKQRCTPLGYALHGISDLLGFVALLLLFGIGAYLGHRGFVGTFRASLLWLFSIPFWSRGCRRNSVSHLMGTRSPQRVSLRLRLARGELVGARTATQLQIQ